MWRTKSGYPAPKLLLDESEVAYLTDTPVDGSVGNGDVLVEYLVGSIDVAVHNRPEIRHYLIDDADKVTRVDPIVLSPRDFADEWIRHPWPESSRWTEPGSRPVLELKHKKWNSETFGEFTTLFHCAAKPDLWQVGIALDKETGSETYPQYFLVRWRPPYHFTMVDVSDHPWPE